MSRKPMMARDAMGDSIQAVSLGTTVTGTVGASSDVTAALGYTLIRIMVDVLTHIKIGEGALEATTDDAPLPAGSVEYFRVSPTDKVAFIANSTTGTIWITEVI